MKQLNPTTVRATLYFAIAFLAPFSDKVLSTLYTSQWPTMQILAASSLSGTIAGLIALRAYLDGSALRNKQENETSTVSETKKTETIKVEAATPEVK